MLSDWGALLAAAVIVVGAISVHNLDVNSGIREIKSGELTGAGWSKPNAPRCFGLSVGRDTRANRKRAQRFLPHPLARARADAGFPRQRRMSGGTAVPVMRRSPGLAKPRGEYARPATSAERRGNGIPAWAGRVWTLGVGLDPITSSGLSLGCLYIHRSHQPALRPQTSSATRRAQKALRCRFAASKNLALRAEV